MAIEHNVIPNAELHEPKGITTAASDTVYVSAGDTITGAWTKLPACTYGGIYSSDSTIAIATIGTTAKVYAAFDADMSSNNVTVAHATDNITIVTAGDYLVNFQTSFATNQVGDAGVYQFKLRIDGVESTEGYGCYREMSGSNDTGSCSFIGIVTLAAAEVLTIYVESDNGGDADNIDVEDTQLSVILLKAS